MKHKYFIIIIFSLFSCIKQNEIIHEKESHKSIYEIQSDIESNDILFNSSLSQYGIFSRGYPIIYLSTSNIGYGMFSGIRRKPFQFKLWNDDSSNVSKKLKRLNDTLFRFFRNNNLLEFDIEPYMDIKSDSSIIIITTILSDSSYYKLKGNDSTFFDYELPLDDTVRMKGKYLYTLIYKRNDSINSRFFVDIKSKHTLRKIKNNWYYYRSYYYNDRFTFDNFFDF